MNLSRYANSARRIYDTVVGRAHVLSYIKTVNPQAVIWITIHRFGKKGIWFNVAIDQREAALGFRKRVKKLTSKFPL